jgi:hypothetical protein
MRPARALIGVTLACVGCALPRGPLSQPTWNPYEVPTALDVDVSVYLGCYRATYLDAARGESQNTWTFLLDSLPPEPRPGGGSREVGARLSRTTTQQGYYASYWRPIRGGFLLSVGDGMHNYVRHFIADGDSLIGRQAALLDVAIPRRDRRLSARRVSCEEAGWPGTTLGRVAPQAAEPGGQLDDR